MQDGTQVVQPQAIQAGGQVIQLGTPAAASATSLSNVQQQQQQQTTTTSTTTANSGNQNIIMMVPGATGGSPTIQRIPLPGKKIYDSIGFGKIYIKGLFFYQTHQKIFCLLHRKIKFEFYNIKFKFNFPAKETEDFFR